MKELEVETDKVKLTSYPQSAHPFRPSYHISAAFQRKHSSLPHLQSTYSVQLPNPRMGTMDPPTLNHQHLYAAQQVVAPQTQVYTSVSSTLPISVCISAVPLNPYVYNFCGLYVSSFINTICSFFFTTCASLHDASVCLSCDIAVSWVSSLHHYSQYLPTKAAVWCTPQV